MLLIQTPNPVSNVQSLLFSNDTVSLSYCSHSLASSLVCLPAPPMYCFSSVAKSCPTLCDPMDYTACQALLSMGLPRQEYWSGFPFPYPGDLLNPEIKPKSPDLAGFFTAEPPGKPNHILNILKGHESSEKEVITSRRRLRSTS